MKKVVVALIGIGLFLLVLSLFNVAARASETATFDGKMLSFPSDARLDPVDISSLQFSLGNVPRDKEFVKKGNVFEFPFTIDRGRRGRHEGVRRYAIFTKWAENGNIEIFYYPSDPRIPAEKPFLDCTSTTTSNNEYACAIRGRPVGNTYRLIFNDGETLTIKSDDGYEASSKVVGEIPILATTVQTSPSQP